MTYIDRSGFTYYDADGSQHHSRAPFLILACDVPGSDLYACIRVVALSQCGHWMMGTARIAGESVCMSGSYGSDGLPGTLADYSDRVRAAFVRVPDDIVRAYWHADDPGWNSAGSEAPTLARWARANMAQLRAYPGGRIDG